MRPPGVPLLQSRGGCLCEPYRWSRLDRMSLRTIQRLFRTLRPRPVMALLAIHLAITGTGIPCLLVCMAAEASEMHEQSAGHESESADHHDSCPDDSPCVKDQAPAVAAHGDALLSPDDVGVALAFVTPGTTHLPAGEHPLTPIAMPDRSPPIPPGFVVLRI